MKSPVFHLIVAFVVAIAAIVGYGFWYNAVSAKSSDVASLQSQISSQAEAVNNIVSTREALTEIAGDEASMQNYFVPGSSMVTFIDGLEAQGRTQGTTVSVLSVSTGSTSVQPTFTLALTIKGTFDAVMRTVGAIEYSPYDLSISEFSMRQEGKNVWHADLNLLVGSSVIATSTPNTP
jgi:hypothetical protein